MSTDIADTDVGLGNSRPETTPAPKTVAPGPSAQSRGASRLRLLLELEPAHRVFFQNLTDLFLFRSPPPIASTSAPAPFWSDVFVYSGVPWWWFVESLLGHMILVAAVLILFQRWPASEPRQQRSVFDKSYVSYYTPPKSLLALGSNRPRVRAQSNRTSVPAHRPTIRVAPERAQGQGQKQAMMRPPGITPARAAQLRMTASNPLPPMMPLSATGRSHLTVPASLTWVVAPLPDSNQATGRRPGLLQASAVPPAPEVEGVSSRRASAPPTAPHAAVIAPPPSVSGSVRRVGDINIGESAVVKPAPQLPTYDQGAVSGMAKGGLGNSGSAVIPPPPPVQGSGAFSDGRANLLSSASSQPVPPAPSVQGVGNVAGSGRASSLSSAGSGFGLQAIPPASPGPDADKSVAGELSTEMGKRPAVAPAPSTATADPHEPATVEIPLRLIGPVLVLPGSSYFSNYEVFIAERMLGNDQSQFIKLVYLSLPYQRRLSEYGLNNSTVYKLRVTRDQTCDESLLRMTWPEPDPRLDSPGVSSKDRNGMLPCYRTTADDYRRALSRSR